MHYEGEEFLHFKKHFPSEIKIGMAKTKTTSKEKPQKAAEQLPKKPAPAAQKVAEKGKEVIDEAKKRARERLKSQMQVCYKNAINYMNRNRIQCPFHQAIL